MLLFQRVPVCHYKLSLCIRQQNVVQLMLLMLLSEALETLRMVSERLKVDNYKKVIPSWGHSIRCSRGLWCWNKSIARIDGNNADTFNWELPKIHNGKVISSLKLSIKNNHFLKCLNQSRRVFFWLTCLISFLCYAQKRSNWMKFCDHVTKISLRDDLRVLSANYMNFSISRNGLTKWKEEFNVFVVLILLSTFLNGGTRTHADLYSAASLLRRYC